MEQIDQRVKILLVDDENLVRVGLRMILEGDPSIQVVGECSNGREALEAVATLSPELVLMDIRMPIMDGLEASAHLLGRDPELKILVLTTFNTDQMVLTALKAGVSGFLLKDTPPAELVAAIHRVTSGHTVLSEQVTKQLIAAASQHPADSRKVLATEKLERLTEREREIAGAMARGLSNAEIANAMFISLATVKTHIGRVLEKLDLGNRVQVALCVYESES